MKSEHRSNTKIIRLTGIGRQNIGIVERADKTLQELIDELDARKPGARALIEENMAVHKKAIDEGTWRPRRCYM
jgi:hypothetical protein